MISANNVTLRIGKKALFVGDSISVGYEDCAMAYGWGGRIAAGD